MATNVDVVKDAVIQEMDNQLAKYKDMNIDKMESDLNAYNRLGTPEEVSELVVRYKNAMTKLARYEDMGTPEEVQQLADAYDTVATAAQAKEDDENSLLAEYQALGTPEEIKQLIAKYSEAKKEQAADEIATEMNVDPAIVKSTIEKTESIAEAKDLLRMVFENNNLKSFRLDKNESVKQSVAATARNPSMDRLSRLLKNNI